MNSRQTGVVTIILPSNGIIHISCNKIDSVLLIKKKLVQLTGISIDSQILLQSGYVIQNEVIMQDLVTSSRRIVNLTLDIPMIGGASNIAPVIAPDMSSDECFEKRNFGKAPFYRTISKGINIQGVCRNSKCVAFNDLVDIQLRMCNDNHGVCNYAEVMFELPCPACKECISHTEIKNIFFIGCLATIKYKVYDKSSEVQQYEIQAPSDKYLALKDPEKFLKYHYIKFTLK
ncbi:Ubiquitin [Oopsacas minuta]|uniref:Ubiquitin n=1 Tax=Oopsacas minuta TaxID=111878 RepID=A0AAV7KBX8_9METZ|nr:Ubiquitin [Oopsacas minuta]